jgi:hypothetical protein
VEDVKPQTSPSLIEELANARIADRRCGVLKVMESMTKQESAQLVSVIDDPHVSLIDVVRIMKNHGFSVSEKMLYRHRRRGDGGCECPR